MMRKIHLVKLEDVSSPKDRKGLEMKNLAIWNDAFQLKLSWRLFTNVNSVWTSVLKFKYFNEVNGWQFPKSKGSKFYLARHLCSNWNALLRVVA